MKTPYAILIGLALIAAALFFRQPAVAPAQAGLIGGVDGFECGILRSYKDVSYGGCAVLHGDNITFINYRILTDVNNSGLRKNRHDTGIITPWR